MNGAGARRSASECAFADCFFSFSNGSRAAACARTPAHQRTQPHTHTHTHTPQIKHRRPAGRSLDFVLPRRDHQPVLQRDRPARRGRTRRPRRVLLVRVCGRDVRVCKSCACEPFALVTVHMRVHLCVRVSLARRGNGHAGVATLSHRPAINHTHTRSEGNDVGGGDVWTYARLLDEVNRLANWLKAAGVSRGHDVTVYMPMIPELPAAMARVICTSISNHIARAHAESATVLTRVVPPAHKTQNPPATRAARVRAPRRRALGRLCRVLGRGAGRAHARVKARGRADSVCSQARAQADSAQGVGAGRGGGGG